MYAVHCYMKNHITHCNMINVQLDLRIILCSYSCCIYPQLYSNIIIYNYSLTTDIANIQLYVWLYQGKCPFKEKEQVKCSNSAALWLQISSRVGRFKIAYVSSIHPLEYKNSKLQSNYIYSIIHSQGGLAGEPGHSVVEYTTTSHDNMYQRMPYRWSTSPSVPFVLHLSISLIFLSPAINN